MDKDKENKMTNHYAEIGKYVGDLVSRKQIQYGDSFSRSQEILNILYPNGITKEAYKDAFYEGT